MNVRTAGAMVYDFPGNPAEVLPPETPSSETQICAKCGLDKPIIEFRLQARPKARALGRRVKVCHKCNRNRPIAKACKHAYARTPKGWYVKAKNTASRRGIEFSLSQNEYVALVSQPCYYCQGKLCGSVQLGVGLDRLNSSVGYVVGNVVSCGGNCNRLKSDWMTPEEAMAAIQAILALRSRK